MSTTDVAECRWCGMIHKGMCSLVKSIEFYEDGSVKHVEFHNRSSLIEQFTKIGQTAKGTNPDPDVIKQLTTIQYG